MDEAQLIEHVPRLFHVTDAGAWPWIARHGLLSTSALLDLYEVTGHARAAIEAAPRPDDVVLEDPRLGRAVVRDNRPLRPDILRRCLDGTTVAGWCRLLNARVFFWAGERRLATHLGARGHRGAAREVIVVDTAALVARHGDAVTLCACNSGSTLYPNAPRRGPATFQPIADYPFDAWRARRGARDAVAEVCVRHGIADVPAVATCVWAIAAGGARRTIWRRDAGSPQAHAAG